MPILGPEPLTDHDWYYEYPSHLLLVHEVKAKDGSHIRTDQIKIPWRKIKTSLKRSYRLRKRKS